MMNHIIYKTLILLMFSTTSVQTASLLPVGEPEYDFLYHSIERTEASGKYTISHHLAPYFFEHSEFQTNPLSFLTIPDNQIIHLFAFARERYTLTEDNKANAFETVQGGVTLSPFKKVYLYSSISLDEEKAEDITYTGKKWRGLAGGVDQSYIYYNSERIDVQAGRFKSFWGIRESLLLSSSNALDGIGYTLTWRSLQLSYRLAKLNQWENSLDNTTYYNRYFAAHRLDFQLSQKLRIGIFESIIFSGVGRTIELNYLNPILFFHSDQLNDNVNDNTFLGFDVTYYPNKKTKVYGQLVVDDFQIEKKSQGDEEPNEYGVILGSRFTDAFKSCDIHFRYVRITNRTYNQAFPENRYINGNDAISYFNSNDFDNFELSVSKWLRPLKTVGLTYNFNRQGEGSIAADWTEPWLDTETSYSEPFPTGLVEKQHRMSIFLKGYFFQYLFLDTKAGVAFIKNKNNQPSASKKELYLNVSLSGFISSSL